MNSTVLEHIVALESMFAAEPLSQSIDVAQWPAALQQARTLISELQESPNFSSIIGVPRWTRLIRVLQKIAYLDPDGGGEPDIASWCERQWATILQNHPQNVTALQGQHLLTIQPMQGG